MNFSTKAISLLNSVIQICHLDNNYCFPRHPIEGVCTKTVLYPRVVTSLYTTQNSPKRFLYRELHSLWWPNLAGHTISWTTLSKLFRLTWGSYSRWPLTFWDSKLFCSTLLFREYLVCFWSSFSCGHLKPWVSQTLLSQWDVWYPLHLIHSWVWIYS